MTSQLFPLTSYQEASLETMSIFDDKEYSRKSN